MEYDWRTYCFKILYILKIYPMGSHNLLLPGSFFKTCFHSTASKDLKIGAFRSMTLLFSDISGITVPSNGNSK